MRGRTDQGFTNCEVLSLHEGHWWGEEDHGCGPAMSQSCGRVQGAGECCQGPEKDVILTLGLSTHRVTKPLQAVLGPNRLTESFGRASETL